MDFSARNASRALPPPGKLLSKSEWRDEQSVAKWRNTLRHRMAQTQGRLNDFADYKITVATPVRCYTLSSRDEAPNDSNRYFNLWTQCNTPTSTAHRSA